MERGLGAPAPNRAGGREQAGRGKADQDTDATGRSSVLSVWASRSVSPERVCWPPVGELSPADLKQE